MKSKKSSKKVGYARVSTDEQNLDLQVRALKQAGCDVIYTDSGVSGSTRSRPGLDRALGSLRKGDKLVVWRLDRLGRSLLNLIQLLENLGTREISFRSLCEYIDTSSSGGRLVFHMMAALAEFERSLISERTLAGMAAARARGQHLGRQPSLNTSQCAQAHLLLSEGLDVYEVAQRFEVTPRTLSRLVRRYRDDDLAAAQGAPGNAEGQLGSTVETLSERMPPAADLLAYNASEVPVAGAPSPFALNVHSAVSRAALSLPSRTELSEDSHHLLGVPATVPPGMSWHNGEAMRQVQRSLDLVPFGERELISGGMVDIEPGTLALAGGTLTGPLNLRVSAYGGEQALVVALAVPFGRALLHMRGAQALRDEVPPASGSTRPRFDRYAHPPGSTGI
jgi:DNA invertase Pin-like site-specific DNA recombinase